MFYPTKVWRKAAEIIRLILHATPHSVIPASRTRLRPSIPCLERNWQCPSLSILHGARHFGDIYPHDQTFEWPYDDVYTHSNIMHIYIYIIIHIYPFFSLPYVTLDLMLLYFFHIISHYIYIHILHICMYVASCFPDVFLPMRNSRFCVTQAIQVIRSSLPGQPGLSADPLHRRGWVHVGELRRIRGKTCLPRYILYNYIYSIWGKICLYTKKMDR